MVKCIVFYLLFTTFNLRVVFAQPDETPVFSVFLIGDAGYHIFPDTALRMLQAELLSEKYSEKSAVVFLGDNIYPGGLAPTNGKQGKVNNGLGELKCFKEVNEATAITNRMKLLSQLKGLENYKGSIYMIPGNHDWQNGQKHGQKFINNERDTVNGYFKEGKLKKGGYYPKKLFGPDDVLIDAGRDVKIRLIFLDTQWYLHSHHNRTDFLSEKNWREKEEILDSCLMRLSQIIENAKVNNEYVLIAAHHPVYTFGKHGKHSKISATLIARRMYYQNIGSKRYNLLRNAIDSVCSLYSPEKLVYAAGHDHNLQYFELPGYVQIVSGAGSKTTNSDRNNIYKPDRLEDIPGMKNMYGSFNTNGFFRLDYFKNSKVRIKVWDSHIGEINPADMEYIYKLGNEIN